MKRRCRTIVLLACSVSILVSAAGAHACTATKEGDPAFYWGFESESADVCRGSIHTYNFAPVNFGTFGGSSCGWADTFCMHAWDTGGWTIVGQNGDDPPLLLDGCWELAPGYYDPSWDITIEVPCEADIGDRDTLFVMFAYCGAGGSCEPECGDCPDGDPSIYAGTPYYQIDTLILRVVAASVPVYVLQDSLTHVGQGQSPVYIPFAICNGDPCAPPTVFRYNITSLGHVGDPIDQSGETSPLPGGECEDVYGIVDASVPGAPVGAFDTLTIIVWDTTGAAYDTCVQIINIYEFFLIPLFSTPVLVLLVLVLLLAAGVLMRRGLKK